MERKDLVTAMGVLPDLPERWQRRRHELHIRLEGAWGSLGKEGGEGAAARRNVPALYKEIARTDRVISFLDRALVHLDDIDRGTHHADGMPIRPGSSPQQNRHGAPPT